MYEYYIIPDDYDYCFDDDELILRPPKVIGEIRRAIIHKKHIYFHCRSMLR